MDKRLVNNYEAANALQRFKNRFMDPLEKKLGEAKAILDDKDYEWKEGQELRAKSKMSRLDTDNIDYYKLYNAVFDLIREHEGLVHELSSIYAAYERDGMKYDLFERIHKILKPLGVHEQEFKNI